MLLTRHRALVPLALLAALAVAAPADAAQKRSERPAKAKAAAACPSAYAAPSRANLEEIEHTVLCLLNFERRRRGLPSLDSNRRLAHAATRHSRDMVRRDYFSHVTPGGTTMGERVKDSGYLSGARWYTVGENIAWGTGSYGTPLRIVRSWMNSPGHRANILRRQYREIGIGVALGAPGQGRDGATYTTNFGTRDGR